MDEIQNLFQTFSGLSDKSKRFAKTNQGSYRKTCKVSVFDGDKNEGVKEWVGGGLVVMVWRRLTLKKD